MVKNKVHIYEPIYIRIIKGIAYLYSYFKLGYRRKNKYKVKRGEKVIVLSNHQSDYDPILIRLSFNRFLYTLATDNIFANKTTAKWLERLGGIPKRKGLADLKSVIRMKKLSSSGASILMFPEGNRSYAEFQYYIDDNFSKWVSSLEATIVLFNLHGGFGCYPRFGNKKRKGKFTGEIKRVLKYEEYSKMSPEELQKIILDELKVFDSDSNEKYKSNSKAEYLERMFFVCPKCNSINTLVSNGNTIKCDNCNLEVAYEENLTLTSNDKDFKYNRLIDWYEFQKEYVKNMELPKSNNKVIFTDDNVTLFMANPFEGKIVLSKGTLKLYKDKLVVGDYKLPIEDIEIASPVSGRTLCVTINEDNYQIKGEDRFNALKYVFLFNKLDTKMKKNQVDKYYSLD